MMERGDSVGTDSIVEPETEAETRRNRDEGGRFVPGRTGLPDSCRHGHHGKKALLGTMRELAREENWLESLGELGDIARGKLGALVSDAGGEEQITEARAVLIKLIVLRELTMEAGWRFLLSQGGPVDRRKKRFRPLVLELEKLAVGQTKALAALGLERRAKSIPNAIDIIRGNGNGDAP